MYSKVDAEPNTNALFKTYKPPVTILSHL